MDCSCKKNPKGSTVKSNFLVLGLDLWSNLRFFFTLVELTGFLSNLFTFGCVDFTYGKWVIWFLIHTTFIYGNVGILSLCATANTWIFKSNHSNCRLCFDTFNYIRILHYPFLIFDPSPLSFTPFLRQNLFQSNIFCL